jgi:formate-dependent nitrite reductase membrane component NrfD
MIEIWLTISVIVNIISYVWNMYYTTVGGRESAYELIKGKLFLSFIGGVIVLGITIPLVLATYSYFIALPYVILGIGSFLSLVGGILLRYSILKAGIFPPLFPLFAQIRQ